MITSHVHRDSYVSDDHSLVVVVMMISSVSSLVSVMMVVVAVVMMDRLHILLYNSCMLHSSLGSWLGDVVAHRKLLIHLRLRRHVSLRLTIAHVWLAVGLTRLSIWLVWHSIWILRVSISRRWHIRIVLGLGLVGSSWWSLIERRLHTLRRRLHAWRVHHVWSGPAWRCRVTLVILRELLVVVLRIHKFC